MKPLPYDKPIKAGEFEPWYRLVTRRLAIKEAGGDGLIFGLRGQVIYNPVRNVGIKTDPLDADKERGGKQLIDKPLQQEILTALLDFYEDPQKAKVIARASSETSGRVVKTSSYDVVKGLECFSPLEVGLLRTRNETDWMHPTILVHKGKKGLELLERDGNWQAVQYNRNLFWRLYGGEEVEGYRTAAYSQHSEMERGRIYMKPTADAEAIKINLREIHETLVDFLNKINPTKLERLAKGLPPLIFTTSNLIDKLYPDD